ncbi:DUF2243 domain-containing protein [Paenibacillus chartarius]|uniref:DUF2243 domain-containing protein n=1 Tax=Paenibacillus chartarius TaxID=747481 RepID=A0ABV6DNN8_9BACL
MKRLLGVITGAFITYQVQHIVKAYAFGYTAENLYHRLGAVLFGIVVLFIFMETFRRMFGQAFFNGFIVATGLFLSFDIVIFHWIFRLHRITSGAEANVLEPIFVAFGLLFLWHGVRRELRGKRS